MIDPINDMSEVDQENHKVETTSFKLKDILAVHLTKINGETQTEILIERPKAQTYQHQVRIRVVDLPYLIEMLEKCRKLV